VDQVHRLFRRQPGLDLLGDEEADDLTLARLDLLTGDRQLGVQAQQLEGAGGGVVVGQGDPVEADLAAARDQVVEGRRAVVRVAAVEVEVDPQVAPGGAADLAQRKRRMIFAGLRALTD
jgi:hypothetical protein